MSHVKLSRDGELAIVALDRGKVNALNPEVIAALDESFDRLEADDGVRGVVLTGTGKFFSFGFDVPEFMDYSKERFTGFLETFTALYRTIYSFPKPVIGALNGHAVAGGCMLAMACDRRIMARGRARISLNEISFGASVFAGIAGILKAILGQREAEAVLFGGKMLDADEAVRVGLIDAAADPGGVLEIATAEAREMASRDTTAFGSIKGLLRGPVVEEMLLRDRDAIDEFVEIWYSESTREKLRDIRIHG